MTIKIGDRMPAAELLTATADGPSKISTDAIFKDKTVVLIGVPGAFTPTCSMNHLPGFLTHLDEIKAKGVDTVACVSVNDVHVVKAWGKHAGAEDKILMLADGNGDFAKATGLAVDLNVAGMGMRNKRYSMLVENGIVRQLNVEDKSGVNISGADTILQQL